MIAQSELSDADNSIFKSHNCPKCNRGLLLFASTFYKKCCFCNLNYEWNLKDNQLPLIKATR